MAIATTATVIDADVDQECNCDIDRRCTYPPCVAEAEAEYARQSALFAHSRGTYRMDRAEWDNVYADEPTKRLAFATHGTL